MMNKRLVYTLVYKQRTFANVRDQKNKNLGLALVAIHSGEASIYFCTNRLNFCNPSDKRPAHYKTRLSLLRNKSKPVLKLYLQQKQTI